MTEALHPVAYAATSPPPGSQRLVYSSVDFETTRLRLRESIERADLWLIHELDPRALLMRGGYEILPIRQLLFFHPRYMARVLEVNPHAIVEAPLKIIVMQMPDGSVSVRHPDARIAFSRYEGLDPLGAELARVYEMLRGSVAA